MLLFWIFLYEWIQISTIQSSAQKTGELSQSLAHLLMLRKMFLKAPVVSSRVREWPSSRVAEWPSGRVAEWTTFWLFFARHI